MVLIVIFLGVLIYALIMEYALLMKFVVALMEEQDLNVRLIVDVMDMGHVHKILIYVFVIKVIFLI
jgi:hypothetical protein